MARIDIPFIVNGQQITQQPRVKIAAGGKNYFFAVFRTCGTWGNIPYKRASFRKGNIRKVVDLVPGTDGCLECLIPWEVMTEVGYFDTGIFGGDRLPTTTARTFVIRGCDCEGEQALAPTPDWFSRIEKELNDLKNNPSNSSFKVEIVDGVLRLEQVQNVDHTTVKTLPK